MGSYIYIFTNSYKPVLGGIQTVTSQLAETLKARGEKVVVVTKLGGLAKKPYSKICGVPVFRFLFAYNFELIFLYLLFLLKRPKAVYVHFPQEQAKFVLKLRKCFSFKIVTCFHGHDVLMYREGFDQNNNLFQWKYKLVHASDCVTSCSKYLGSVVCDVFECGKVIPVYNGVNLSRYGKKALAPDGFSGPYLFAFGRLEKIKGYQLLIEAFSNLNDYPNHSLYIAGEGSFKMELQKRIKKFHLEDRVFLIGRKTPNEIVQLTQHAEVIVIPSLRESFGIVVLEAIAAMRPVVATEAGGIPEIMDDRFGVLVSPSVKGLVYGIEKALNRKDYQFDSVDEYLKGFTVDKMVDNYIKLIGEDDN